MPIVNAIAGVLLVGFGVLLIGIALLVFAMPGLAERFFTAFASSARTHYAEQAVRLLVGASLIIRSAAMWQPKLFWFVGWAIALTSLLLILTPWQWHNRFGEKVRPMLIRRMKVYAVGLLVFGVLLIYAVLTGASTTAQQASQQRQRVAHPSSPDANHKTGFPPLRVLCEGRSTLSD
jgi:hypothetical protein